MPLLLECRADNKRYAYSTCREYLIPSIVKWVCDSDITTLDITCDMRYTRIVLLGIALDDLLQYTPGIVYTIKENNAFGTRVAVTLTGRNKDILLFAWWWTALLMRIVARSFDKCISMHDIIYNSYKYDSLEWSSAYMYNKTCSTLTLMEAGGLTHETFARRLRRTDGPVDVYNAIQRGKL